MEWKTVKLQDVCIRITDGSHFSPQAQTDGYPMFSVKDMLEYGFDYSNCKRISKADFDVMVQNDCVPQKGDVLVAKDGSFLKSIFLCKETKEEAILSSIAIFRPDDKKISPAFLCYLLKSPSVYNYIASNCVSGSALPRIVLKDFKQVDLSIPDIETQRRIAAILSSLDDKIENNNRINRNLEAQAQALFKSWFVDFEPWGGIMPEDWKNGVLGEICKIKYGKGLSTNLLTDEGYPVFGGNGVIGYYSKFLYELPQILVSCRGAASGKIMESDPHSFVTSNSLVLEMNDRAYYYYLKYLLLANPLYNYATGSAQPQITIDNIKDVDIVLPSIDIVNTISEKFEVIDEQIRSLRRENDRLASLRDTLLPKLMKGEMEL